MDGKHGRADSEALVALLRSDRTEVEQAEAVARADLARVIGLSIEQHVSAIVGKQLGRLEVEIPPSSRRDLERVQLVMVARRLHTEHTIAQIGGIIDVPFLVVKGPVIAERWYPDAGDREYGDLDVVVRRRDFRAVLEQLEERGCERLLANWHGWLEAGVAEVPLRFGSTTIDLHWSLVALTSTRSELRLPEQQMFDRRTSVSFGSGATVDVETLDPTDSVLHLCVNVALGGARHLRNLVDLDLMLRHPDLDAREFARRVRVAGTERMVSTLLDRCRRFLGTPIPIEIERGLGTHRLWRSASSLVDRSAQPLRGSRSPGIMLSSGRSTVIGTSIALVLNARESTMLRLGVVSPTAPGGQLDWNRNPLDGDVEGARHRYLDWVDDVHG